MKVAYVHDWLTGMRGGEKVLEILLEFFPEAPLHTLLHIPGSVSEAIEAHPIRTSFVQRLPMAASRYRYYLPFFPRAIESFDLSGYDLIISSSSCVAKGARPAPEARHLCYIYAPMRYAWDQYDAYFGQRRDFLGRHVLPRAMAYLRNWDRRSASRVQHFVADSENVRSKVERFYEYPADRTSVAHPPADTDFYRPAEQGEDTTGVNGEISSAIAAGPYYFIVSAMVPYKRLDLAVAAFRGGSRRLLIAGGGPDEARLRELAGADPAIRFLGKPEDIDLRALYRGASAFLMPGEEDFGITPVESQACGRPVIALGAGGALETVRDGETGLFFADATESSLADALDRFEARTWDPALARRQAQRFTQDGFRRKMAAELERFMSREMPR